MKFKGIKSLFTLPIILLLAIEMKWRNMHPAICTIDSQIGGNTGSVQPGGGGVSPGENRTICHSSC